MGHGDYAVGAVIKHAFLRPVLVWRILQIIGDVLRVSPVNRTARYRTVVFRVFGQFGAPALRTTPTPSSVIMLPVLAMRKQEQIT